METQVLVIGGGATGTALARDLSLRGLSCLLVEREDLNAGASGRNHGLLHSGARYAATDPAAAIECREEGALLKRMAPQCIQDTGGLFVAVAGDDERFVADFPAACARAGIEARPVPVAEAREMEPSLSERTIAAFAVPDASVDPFDLSLQQMAHAQGLGAALLRRTAVRSFERSGGRLRAARAIREETGEELRIEAQMVVNATGAWAGEVARLCGADVPMLHSKGTLLVTHARLAHRVVNRCRRPSDADIVMPGGTVSIVGTTSVAVRDLADVRPTVAEVDRIVEEASAMMPALATARYIRAYAGVRPLVTAAPSADGRAVSRGFTLVDHERDGIENLLTITGGKLTTCRLMAERTADRVCERLGVAARCRTRDEPLPAAPGRAWTEPGLAARSWMADRRAGDPLLCECEMVSRGAFDAVADRLHAGGGAPSLSEIALRSRLGKGACQGTFCAVRAAAHLADRCAPGDGRALAEMIQFLRERWRGQPAILWGEQLAQAELTEAVHCALHGAELAGAGSARAAGRASRS